MEICKYVKEPNGNIIDLSNIPLYYGEKDKLNDKMRRSFNNFENKYYQSPIEYGRLITLNGKILQEAKGDATKVQTKTKYWLKAAGFSHIHPREQGVLGGTFSTGDMIPFVKYGIKTIRASTKEGTYSFTKKTGFKNSDFKKYYESKCLSAQTTFSGRIFLINKAYKKGEIDSLTYQERYNYYINEMFVEMHNALIEGQNEFKYYYTLERR